MYSTVYMEFAEFSACKANMWFVMSTIACPPVLLPMYSTVVCAQICLILAVFGLTALRQLWGTPQLVSALGYTTAGLMFTVKPKTTKLKQV